MRCPECGGYYYKRKGQGFTCPKCMVRMNTKNIKTPPIRYGLHSNVGNLSEYYTQKRHRHVDARWYP